MQLLLLRPLSTLFNKKSLRQSVKIFLSLRSSSYDHSISFTVSFHSMTQMIHASYTIVGGYLLFKVWEVNKIGDQNGLGSGAWWIGILKRKKFQSKINYISCGYSYFEFRSYPCPLIWLRWSARPELGPKIRILVDQLVSRLPVWYRMLIRCSNANRALATHKKWAYASKTGQGPKF